MHRISLLILPVVSLMLLGLVDRGHAQDLGRPDRGRALAQRNCAECHAVLKTEERSPNAAAPRFETIANVRGMTAIALRAAFQTPHRQMPNIILDGNELTDVIAYILSLKQTN